MAAALVIAHLGHWYVSLPIFMGPMLLLAAWVAIAGRRERRREDRGEGFGLETDYGRDRANLTLLGRLDREALAELEVELRFVAVRGLAGIVLDLQRVTFVEEGLGSRLSEMAGDIEGSVRVTVVVAREGPAVHDLLDGTHWHVEVIDDPASTALERKGPG